MPKYNFVMRMWHWLSAILIIALLGIGLWMSGLPDDYPGKFDFYGWHKSFGVILLIVMMLRIATRFKSTIPTLPASIRRFDARLSALTIFLLYVSLLLMPVFGYLMSVLGGYGVQVFGLTLPNFFAPDKELGAFFHQAHGIMGYVIIGLIILHLAGTAKHMIFEKVNLLKRIW